jgi:hypothetical protein
MSKRRAEEYYSSDSDDDDTDVDSLMHLLDDVGPAADLSLRSGRAGLPVEIGLMNFGLNENGPVNYRDATVLGHHTRIRIPSSYLTAERIKLSIFLNHDAALSADTHVQRPVINDKILKSRDDMLRRDYKLERHETWIDPSTLIGRDNFDIDGVIEFKKSKWPLSRGFSDVAGVRWAKFILLATAYRSGSAAESCVSQQFEVRSKEQSNKSRAARGLSESIRRRRTPETEARAVKLRRVQGQIMAIRDEISRENKLHVEYQTTTKFVRAITKNCPEASHIYSIVR